MGYDLNDTIAAISTPAGGAARGMIRISGPQTLDCLAKFFSCENNATLKEIKVPTVLQGTFHCKNPKLDIPGDLFLWPTDRSYTRQPSAELHTLGSPPLLEAALYAVCTQGARVAEPGEFTLRAFLAGRMDLTQAEAVLGVIDARDQQSLNTALAQLAGGLSQPLTELRETLLQILAELEAGLDFVDEDIEFISHEVLKERLTEAQQTVLEAIEQISSRADTLDMPRVALLGAPNVGKSSLFNALIATGKQDVQALVSDQSGTTRDYVTAVLQLEGLACLLVDTAGQETSPSGESIEQSAQKMASEQVRQANLRLVCIDTLTDKATLQHDHLGDADSYLIIHTKSDLDTNSIANEKVIACSSVTGAGIETLRRQIREQLINAIENEGGAVAATSARCTDSLHRANEALTRSRRLVEHAGDEELLAAEIRDALTELGRVVGAVYTDDILDRIFSQFCIGK